MNDHIKEALAVVATLVLFFAHPVTGQNNTAARTILRKDVSALAVLTQAMTAMGGSKTWASVADSTLSGSCSSQNADDSGSPASNAFIWMTKGAEYRYETAMYGPSAILLSGHGNPTVSLPSQSWPVSIIFSKRNFPFQLPALELERAQTDPSISIVLLSNDQIGTAQRVHLRMSEHFGPVRLEGTQQDWWFDPSSGLPVRVSFILPSTDGTMTRSLTWDFTSWQTQGSVTVPQQLTETMDKHFQLQACAIQSVQLNTAPSDSLFDGR